MLERGEEPGQRPTGGRRIQPGVPNPSNAQSTLQKAQSTLASANSSLASAQSKYNTAVIPANNLAAEQAMLVTLQQHLDQYRALAGTSTNVALSLAQQYQQQAQNETLYVLPGLRTAAAQAQNNLNSAP
jgi:hypothetical protein